MSAETSNRSFFAKVAIIGFLLWPLATVIHMVPILLSGATGEVPQFIPYIVLPLIAAALIWRFSTWALVVGVILGLLMTLLVALFGYHGLLLPFAFWDFEFSLLGLVGALMALIGSLAAIVQRRRGTAQPDGTPSQRRALRGVMGALVLLCVVSAALTLLGVGRTTVSAAARSGTTPLTIRNLQFTPARLETQTGQKVRLLVRNEDAVAHTFTIESLGVNEGIAPNSEVIIEFPAAQAGEYKFVCLPHQTMSGTLALR